MQGVLYGVAVSATSWFVVATFRMVKTVARIFFWKVFYKKGTATINRVRSIKKDEKKSKVIRTYGVWVEVDGKNFTSKCEEVRNIKDNTEYIPDTKIKIYWDESAGKVYDYTEKIRELLTNIGLMFSGVAIVVLVFVLLSKLQ